MVVSTVSDQVGRGLSVGMIFKLIIEDDEGKTTVYPLADGEISIGRREGNTIRLMERNVSRRHAKLQRNNGTVFIEDLDSYNGIRINGERITGRYEVNEGDLVEIGDYHLALQRTEMREAKGDSQPDAPREQWPQAGTVPDLPLGQTEDPRNGQRASTVRDTIVDQPVPPALPQATLAHTLNERANPPDAQPLVRPPPKGDAPNRELPPFPGPGGQPLGKVPLMPTGAAADGASVPTPGKALAIGPTRVASVPRLICVSTQYAGKEFALTRPELIIGRVEDNDVVIEHRSVSRNHAKILFDGKTHKIIDLQSANGILVNGEEYAMTDLRKGDLIELGHVRFRFIPAEEVFEPTDDECREMREAGVEPPVTRQTAVTQPSASPLMRAPEVPGEHFPAYDPSMAQTVTDTPLSALNDVPSPRIEAKTVPIVPRANGQHGSGRSEPAKKTSDDERPTEANRVGRGPTSGAHSPIPLADTEPLTKPRARAESRVERPRSSGGVPFGLIGGGLAVVLALVIGGWVLFGQKSKQHDEALQALFENGQYGEVIQYGADHYGEFANPDLVKRLLQESKSRLQQPKVPPPHDEILQPDAEEISPEGDPAEEEDIEDVKTKVRNAAVKAPPPKAVPKKDAADKAYRDGKELATAGDLSGAEKHFRTCVKLSPEHSQCQRWLGVLYAQLNDTQRSCDAYKKYLALQPKASDAERIRAIIQESCQ